jgi:serine protease Do
MSYNADDPILRFILPTKHPPQMTIEQRLFANFGNGLLLLVFLVAGSDLGSHGASAQVPTTFPPNGQTVVETSASPVAEDLITESRSGTQLDVPAELATLYRVGGVPRDLDELRAMESQQRRVSAMASQCTVSVQIGPAQGCGVIITGSGYVLTAAHVAMRPNKPANIRLSDGTIVRARTLGLNRNVDAGLLKIEPNQRSGPWPHASLGTSAGLIPGMWSLASGHPGGYDVGRGPVTRVGRIIEAKPSSMVTDCALIGGDSGGPLFDLGGRLIAIHSRIGNDVSENLHVPIDNYASSWKRMQAGESYGYLPGFRPSLGVRGSAASQAGAVVESVKQGSPADDADIRADDIIDQFGEDSITSFKDLREAVSQTMPGERVDIWLRRNGASRKVRVEIGRADDF